MTYPCLNACMERQWNVFIPHDLLTKPPGCLTGYIDYEQRLICVLGLLTTKHRYATTTTSERSIGYWHGSNQNSFEIRYRPTRNDPKSKRDNNVKLHLLHRDNKISSCLCWSGFQEEESAVCVCLFHPTDILSSYLLSRSELQDPSIADKSKPSVKKSQDVKSGMKLRVQDVLGEQIEHAIHHFQLENLSPEEHLFFRNCSSSLCLQLARNASCVLPRLILTLLSYINFIFQSSYPWLKNLLCVPSLSKHLIERCKRSSNVLQLDRSRPFNKFVLYNTYAQHVFESLVGVCVLYHVTTNNLTDRLATSSLDWADDVASRSHDLIKWLMGAPAGLKLNAQLTSMLGHFFIYHIYLWTGYLMVLRTVLPWLLYCASWAGLLGVSFQLCVVKDIVYMLTIHIYCFYVYAARIFNLQVSALSSMWRLFRGKKWNSLRQRVDSAAYNTDQLFVGTLLFTVLLFLLPTTALYYTVFMGLRVITLTFQSVLTRVIQAISVTPVYSLLLCITRPGWITGCVEFEPICLDAPPSNIVLALKTSNLPISELINLTAPYLNVSTSSTYSWSHFLSRVTSGKILYPWVDPIAETDDIEGSNSAGKTKKE